MANGQSHRSLGSRSAPQGTAPPSDRPSKPRRLNQIVVEAEPCLPPVRSGGNGHCKRLQPATKWRQQTSISDANRERRLLPPLRGSAPCLDLIPRAHTGSHPRLSAAATSWLNLSELLMGLRPGDLPSPPRSKAWVGIHNTTRRANGPTVWNNLRLAMASATQTAGRSALRIILSSAPRPTAFFRQGG